MNAIYRITVLLFTHDLVRNIYRKNAEHTQNRNICYVSWLLLTFKLVIFLYTNKEDNLFNI